MNRWRTAALVVLVGTLRHAPALAQDAHYWTYGYGPIGQLTEGTLVGGVSDLSAVFYNPGALALLEKPRFVVGITSVELANLTIPGIAGEGLDADQLVFDIVPSIVAGQVGPREGDNRFAFAFLSRHDSDWDVGVNDVNIAAGTADAQAGFGRLRQRLVEYWVGGTWSHRLSDTVSVGVSPFFSMRQQRSRRALQYEEIQGGATRDLFVAIENEYDHLRALAKFGVAWRPGSWELGLTVTTPGFALWDAGRVVFNASATGIADPLLSASVQKDLDATYKAPWSVAGGATWRGKRTAVHTTVEWFSSVDPYEILSPDPAPIAGSPETIDLTFRGEAKSIVNFGAGLEQRLSSRVVLYAGAAHNASAHVPLRDTLAAWDLIDVTGGFTFPIGRATCAFGLGYAWGSEEIPQPVRPPSESGPPPLREASFGRWTASFGVSFKAFGTPFQ